MNTNFSQSRKKEIEASDVGSYHNLKQNEVVVICDFKMKIKPGEQFREPQKNYFGKHGIN